jgi:hypothetical protein
MPSAAGSRSKLRSKGVRLKGKKMTEKGGSQVKIVGFEHLHLH